MASRVWLADPAEFEAQPAGFGKRPGPPTSEERDLAASAAALWNALASDAAPRYAEDPEALGRLTARVYIWPDLKKFKPPASPPASKYPLIGSRAHAPSPSPREPCTW